MPGGDRQFVFLVEGRQKFGAKTIPVVFEEFLGALGEDDEFQLGALC